MSKFPDDIVMAAFERQKKKCAGCGKRLYWKHYESGAPGAWHAHHVNGDPENHRLGNCACLCVNPPEQCHLVAHCGDYGGGSVVPKAHLRFWNGRLA